jgi:hypothetical protein
MRLMITVGRLTCSGELNISGKLNERIPQITNGLIAHYPFDATLNHFKYIKGLNVLAYVYNVSYQYIYNWLSSNGANITISTDLTLETVATASKYDLIVADCSVWGVSSAIIDKIKQFTDAGISCVATGNDTRTNYFVKTYNGTASVTHDIIPEQNNYISTNSTLVGAGNVDIYGGIDELQNGARPYYRRSDTNQITGYIYKSAVSGAMFFFDQEGLSMNILVSDAILYILQTSNTALSNVNTTLSTAGLSVEESTLNVVANPDGKLNTGLITGYPWDSTLHPDAMAVDSWSTGYNGGVPSPSIGYHAYWRKGIVNGEPRMVMTFKDINEVYGQSHRWLGIANNISNTPGSSLGWTAGTKLSVSWLQRSTVAGKGACVGIYHKSISTGNSGFGNCINNILCTEVGKWERVGYTTIIDSDWDLTNFANLYVYGSYGASGILEVIDIQVEKKEFYTSFVNGTRNLSSFNIPITLSPPYTFSFDFVPKVPNNYTVMVNWVFTHTPYTDLFFLMWKRTNEDYYRMRIDGLDYVFSNTDIVQNNKYKITLTVNATVTNIYLNGIFKGSIPKSVSLNTIALGYNSSTTFSGSNKFSNVSIYNRELSSSEVALLYNNKFTITKTGDINLSKLIEQSSSTPSDAYIFPLSIDSKDKYKLISSSEDINTEYVNGSVWVGTQVTNLYKQASSPTDFSVVGSGIFNITKVENTTEFTYMYNQNLPWTYHGQTIPMTAGTQYMVSMDIFISNDANIPLTGTMWVANMEGSVSTGFYHDNTKKGTWQHVEKLVTSTGTSTNLYLYPSTSTIPATTGYLKIKNVMVTEKIYYVPFTQISRGTSSLEFNFNRDISLDWSKDWSICYWKNPIATFDNTLTGYNIESLGCNSNSVGGGYIWWGKLNGSNSVYEAGNFDPNKYFGRWRMVSLSKTGTTLTIKEWSSEGIYTRIVSTTNTVSNYYVTQHGYDFKLGGWDNGNPCNSYYRDLIVIKRCLSDVEIQKIYKTHLTADKNNFYVSNSFNTNVIL